MLTRLKLMVTSAMISSLLGWNSVYAGETAEEAIAKAESDLAAAVSAQAVWYVVDKISGTNAVGIDRLLRKAKKKLKNGDPGEAKRIANLVSWAAHAGIDQARAQEDAIPFY